MASIEGPRIRLEPLGEEHAEDLWRVLLSDVPLREANGGTPAPASPEEFMALGRRWAQKTGGLTFAIVGKEDNKAFGSISLSRLNEPAANAGYWLASRSWGQGLGGEAFDLILQVAWTMGLRAVKADGAEITRRPDGAFSCRLVNKGFSDPRLEERTVQGA